MSSGVSVAQPGGGSAGDALGSIPEKPQLYARQEEEKSTVDSTPIIKFEKQKIVPPRARTHSGQSVLSTISLKSISHTIQPCADPDNVSRVTGHSNYGKQNSLVDITQQIQSPAMCSVRRRGTATSGSAGTVLLRRTSSARQNEIGLQVPFTNDNRIDLERSKGAKVEEEPLVKNTPSPLEDSEMENEKLRNSLTTAALKNLSNLNGTNVSGAFAKIANEPAKRGKQAQPDIPEQQTKSNDNVLGVDVNDLGNIKSLTHLKFGDKVVYVDSSASSFVANNNNNNNNNTSFTENARKNAQTSTTIPRQQSSLESLHENKKLVTTGNNVQLNDNQDRRNIKQISHPKKPLYIPAVLRNISETNITNEDIQLSRNNTAAMLRSDEASKNKAYSSLLGNRASSQGTIRSTGSHVLDTCRKRISSFFFQGDEDGQPVSRSEDSLLPNSAANVPTPPIKDHWVPDSKRSSCHYCHKLFTLWERRHHCRHCGDIFCQQHLRHWLYLDSDANYTIGGSGEGVLSKVCDTCLKEYEELLRNNQLLTPELANEGSNKNVNLLDSISTTNNITAGVDAKNSTSQHIMHSQNKKQTDKRQFPSVVGSVPVDWNWSSF